MIMLITLLLLIILIFDEKSLICFKKFNEKNYVILIFKKLKLNWNLKNLKNQFENFKREKKIIKPIIYKRRA